MSLPGPADALAYNPKNGLVYVCHDDGEDVWVVDPGAQKIVTAIKIPTNPEFVVYDPITDKVFQNIKSQPVMIVIDLGPNSVAAIWSTIPAESPHGLAVNPESHRLFSAGKNGKLVVLDSVREDHWVQLISLRVWIRSRSIPETSESTVPPGKEN